jgi:DNA-3-methyladenine glycosylase II
LKMKASAWSEMKLEPTPPYDFELSARIFSGGDGQFRAFDDGTFWQMMRVDSGPFLCRIRSMGDVDRPLLNVQTRFVHAAESNGNQVEGKVNALLNLQLDLKPFYRIVSKNDPILAQLALRLKGLKSPRTETVFEALVDSIIEQQISLDVARVLQLRLIKRFGEVAKIDDATYYAFPQPTDLSNATIEEMRNLGLSLRKAEYIRDSAKAVMDGKIDLESLRDRSSAEDVIEYLTNIRGIGPWTAELVMIRGMGRFDAIPADDLGIKRTISHFYFDGKATSASQVRLLASKWGKWRGLASFYLIMAERIGIEF